MTQSDVTQVNLPTTFVADGVKFTVPALQGMAAHGLDIDWVRRSIREHSLELANTSVLNVDSVTMLFHRPECEAHIELSSIWRNAK